MNKCFILMSVACMFSLDAKAGWYTGVNLGANSVAVSKELAYPLEENEPTKATYHSTYTNFHGQLLAGYDLFLTQKISTALEGNIEVFTGKAQYRVNNWFLSDGANGEEQLQSGFSAFLLPNYHHNSSASFFIGPGISSSKLVTKSGGTGGNMGVTGNFSKWLTGAGFKAGVATPLTKNTDVVFTYQFMQYNSVLWSSVEPFSEDSLSGRYQPYVNTVMIGFRLHSPEFVK